MTEHIKVTQFELKALIDVLESSSVAIGQLGNEGLIAETLNGERAVKAICKRNNIKTPSFI